MASFCGSTYIVSSQVCDYSAFIAAESGVEDEFQLTVGAELVRGVLNGFKDNANAGPDVISAYFLKRCWRQLKSRISHLFNSSLARGYFSKLMCAITERYLFWIIYFFVCVTSVLIGCLPTLLRSCFGLALCPSRSALTNILILISIC